MTVTVQFDFMDRDRTVTATAEPGDRLLDVAQKADVPLEGTCGGVMSCSTCHVIVDPDWAKKLPQVSHEEEELLDLTPYWSPTSRLACQIRLDASLDGLKVKVPPQS